VTGNNGATFGPALICDAAFGLIIFSIPFNPILLVIVVALCLYLIYLCLEQFFLQFFRSLFSSLHVLSGATALFPRHVCV
jgi:hypothetical protein